MTADHQITFEGGLTLYDVRMAANILGTTPAYMRKMVQRGLIASTTHNGKRWFSMAELLRKQRQWGLDVRTFVCQDGTTNSSDGL